MKLHDRPAHELAKLERLSRREREVLTLVAGGKTSKAIAALMLLSPKTVDTYRGRIKTKLEIDDIAGLVKFVIRNGITKL